MKEMVKVLQVTEQEAHELLHILLSIDIRELRVQLTNTKGDYKRYAVTINNKRYRTQRI